MYLTPTAVTLFAPAIALFSIAIYLFIGVKNKSAMEWWLCISTFGFALFDVDLMLWSMFRNYHELGQWLPLMMMFSALLTVYPAIQFVWAFPKSDQPPTGHYKWMMRLYGVLVVIAVTVIAIEQVWGFFVLYFTHQYVYGVVALYAVYTIVLLLEKWWLYRRMYLESAERQEQKDVLEMHQKNLLAARQLLGVSFPLIVLAIISGVFASFAGIGLNDYIIPMVGVSFAVMSAFAVIAYFDFGHKHISLSVKLAGAALLSMLLLLTPMAFLMFPAMRVSYRPNLISNQVSLLRFEPVAESRYRVSAPKEDPYPLSFNHQTRTQRFDFEIPDFPENIDVVYQSQHEIGFEFPFYGQLFDLMEIKPDGMIRLLDQQSENNRRRFNVSETWSFIGRGEQSNLIMPHIGYCVDRQPVISYSAEYVLISWDGELVAENREPCHYNARLWQDGTIDFEYIVIDGGFLFVCYSYKPAVSQKNACQVIIWTAAPT